MAGLKFVVDPMTPRLLDKFPKFPKLFPWLLLKFPKLPRPLLLIPLLPVLPPPLLPPLDIAPPSRVLGIPTKFPKEFMLLVMGMDPVLTEFIRSPPPPEEFEFP